MDGTATGAAARWRHRTCDRIDGFRRGDCDFDGLLMYLAIMARLQDDGTARLRAPVRDALRDFLAAAEPFAAGTTPPPPAAIERPLLALRDAIRSQAD